MSVQTTIQVKVQQALDPQYLLVENESASHNVPPGSESHFKVTVVSDTFSGLRLLHRHRSINKLLAEELAGKIHALALHTYTPEEWQQRGGVRPGSPDCHGGSQADSQPETKSGGNRT